MKETKVTKKFSFESENTCKSNWSFELEKVAGMWLIHSLKIDEYKEPIGCQGHPKTLEILLKNRPVNSLDIESLSGAYCEKEISCSQILAKCINQLKEEFGK
jgi:hypothetical protein